MLEKQFLLLYRKHLLSLMKRLGRKLTYCHFTFSQESFKKYYVLMNQCSRQQTKNAVEKELCSNESAFKRENQKFCRKRFLSSSSNFIPTVDNSENNNSEMVKSCKPGILQHPVRFHQRHFDKFGIPNIWTLGLSRYSSKFRREYFRFLDFWSIPYKRELS